MLFYFAERPDALANPSPIHAPPSTTIDAAVTSRKVQKVQPLDQPSISKVQIKAEQITQLQHQREQSLMTTGPVQVNTAGQSGAKHTVRQILHQCEQLAPPGITAPVQQSNSDISRVSPQIQQPLMPSLTNAMPSTSTTIPSTYNSTGEMMKASPGVEGNLTQDQMMKSLTGEVPAVSASRPSSSQAPQNHQSTKQSMPSLNEQTPSTSSNATEKMKAMLGIKGNLTQEELLMQLIVQDKEWQQKQQEQHRQMMTMLAGSLTIKQQPSGTQADNSLQVQAMQLLLQQQASDMSNSADLHKLLLKHPKPESTASTKTAVAEEHKQFAESSFELDTAGSEEQFRCTTLNKQLQGWSNIAVDQLKQQFCESNSRAGDFMDSPSQPLPSSKRHADTSSIDISVPKRIRQTDQPTKQTDNIQQPYGITQADAFSSSNLSAHDMIAPKGSQQLDQLMVSNPNNNRELHSSLQQSDSTIEQLKSLLQCQQPEDIIEQLHSLVQQPDCTVQQLHSLFQQVEDSEQPCSSDQQPDITSQHPQHFFQQPNDSSNQQLYSFPQHVDQQTVQQTCSSVMQQPEITSQHPRNFIQQPPDSNNQQPYSFPQHVTHTTVQQSCSSVVQQPEITSQHQHSSFHRSFDSSSNQQLYSYPQQLANAVEPLQKPHYPVQQPDSNIQQPHSFNQQPHSFNQQPHSFNQQPHSLNQQPHSFSQQPHSFLQPPDDSIEQLRNLFEQPENAIEQLQSLVQGPGHISEQQESDDDSGIAALIKTLTPHQIELLRSAGQMQ